MSSISCTPPRGGIRRVALVSVLGGLVLALIAPAPALAKHETRFTCQASALRVETFAPLPELTIEPFKTTDAGTGAGECPAADQEAGLINSTELPSGLGTAEVLYAQTSTDNGAESRAGVANLTLNAPDPIGTITAEVLTSEASSTCSATGEEGLSGASTILHVHIEGVPGGHVEVPSNTAPVEVPGPDGTLLMIEFAKQVKTADTITQQALVVTANSPLGGATLAQVVIGEAIADVHDCNPPCPTGSARNHETGVCMKQCPDGSSIPVNENCPEPPPPPPPPPEKDAKCNAGNGNGSEPNPPPDCDPGNSGGKNQGGD